MKYSQIICSLLSLGTQIFCVNSIRTCQNLLSEVDCIISRALKPGSNPIRLHSDSSHTDALVSAQEPSFEELFKRANEHFNTNNFDSAICFYHKAINQNSRVPQAHFNLGITYRRINQNTLAQESFQKAIDLDDHYAKAHFQIAQLLEKDFPEKALAHYKKALEYGESSSSNFLAVGRFLNEIERQKDAVIYLEQAHCRDSENTAIIFELANTYNAVGRNKEALALYKILEKHTPKSTAVLYNIAYTLKRLGHIEEAMPYYQAALEHDPENVNAHFSRSLAYLTVGNFKEGWQEYEWRWKRDGLKNSRQLAQPEWDGSDLNGKKILLHAEQGLGDTFQFIRFARTAKEKGGFVIVASQEPLKKILQLCPYIDKVITLNDPLPFFDVHAALLSLPRILKIHSEQDIPQQIPYLFADTEKTKEWRTKLSEHDSNLKIGLCWQGNSNYHNAFLRAVVAEKSIALKELLSLQNIPHTTWFSLQKITGEQQIKELSLNHALHIFDESFDKERFLDTAAVIKNLDVVVTIDTSIAHLAAALGTPVFLMLPEPADWRWMIQRKDTPWYPSMELFRQQTPGDWSHVIHEIKDRITLLAQAKQENINAHRQIGTLIDDMVRLEIAASLTNDTSKKESYLQKQGHIRSLISQKISQYTLDTYIQKLAELNLALWKVGAALQKTTWDPLESGFIETAHQWTILNNQKKMVTEDLTTFCNSKSL